MDVKVYQKEEVYQPSGTAEVLTPDVIDIIPVTVEVLSTSDIRNNVWSLEKLKRIADVKVEDGKLIINSDKVRYENGNLYVTIMDTKVISCETVTDKELTKQQCAMATIFQRGLDPLDLEDGIQWSEVLLGETNVLQLMEQITQAVGKVSPHVSVEFSTVKTDSGAEVLSYAIKEVG